MDLEKITYHHCYFEDVPDFAVPDFHPLQNRTTKGYLSVMEPRCGTDKPDWGTSLAQSQAHCDSPQKCQ